MNTRPTLVMSSTVLSTGRRRPRLPRWRQADGGLGQVDHQAVTAPTATGTH